MNFGSDCVPEMVSFRAAWRLFGYMMGGATVGTDAQGPLDSANRQTSTCGESRKTEITYLNLSANCHEIIGRKTLDPSTDACQARIPISGLGFLGAAHANGCSKEYVKRCE